MRKAGANERGIMKKLAVFEEEKKIFFRDVFCEKRTR
jgi:hypothetical protein